MVLLMAVKEPRISKPKKGPTWATALGLHGGHMRILNALLRFGAKRRPVQARRVFRRKSLPKGK